MTDDQQQDLPPRTWPEGVAPYPEQLAEWWLRMTPEQLAGQAAVALEQGAIANRCFMMNHDPEHPATEIKAHYFESADGETGFVFRENAHTGMLHEMRAVDLERILADAGWIRA